MALSSSVTHLILLFPLQSALPYLKCLNARCCSGEMNDAAEVLEAIFESLKGVIDGTEIVNQSFGINMEEKVHCRICQRESHEHKYTEHFHTVSATALRIMSAASGGAELGPLLQEIHQQDEKKCDKERGGFPVTTCLL
jgi:hypothetical protein